MTDGQSHSKIVSVHNIFYYFLPIAFNGVPMKKLFTLIAITSAIIPAVHGMDTSPADFEIYQLLSFAAKNDSKFSLPVEIVNIIASTAREITKARKIEDLDYQLRQCHTLYRRPEPIFPEPSSDQCQCAIW